MTTTETTVARVLAGDVRIAARLMRDVDDRTPAARAALKALHVHTGRAYIVGITGNPGAGKSTVVDALIAHYRAAGPAAAWPAPRWPGARAAPRPGPRPWPRPAPARPWR